MTSSPPVVMKNQYSHLPCLVESPLDARKLYAVSTMTKIYGFS